MVENRVNAIADELNAFFGIGYSDEHLIDLVQAMGENYISNLMAKMLQVPIDFPRAPELDEDPR
ncbi:hypothetical protein GCM10023231_00680 [Olivibacter ginsenosidimutans]|uniref:Uncharacterized protein n=1 Tax=Olivibacter ginsenosidimutans TaxID=1176537 RepID=A0ABP9ABM3_9SPHI